MDEIKKPDLGSYEVELSESVDVTDVLDDIDLDDLLAYIAYRRKEDVVEVCDKVEPLEGLKYLFNSMYERRVADRENLLQFLDELREEVMR